MRRITCRHHCSACHGHFSSTNAFDAHRAGDHAGGRYCLEPLDDARFTQLSENGICGVYAEKILGITIWTLADDLIRARERSGWGERRAAGSRPTTDLGRAA